MTTWVLVRHGSTDWNREGRYQGQEDTPLNAEGLAQAALLATKLSSKHIDAVYSSDLRRARETAGLLAQRLGLQVKTDQRLREIHQGEWEGKLGGEIAASYPGAWERMQVDPLNARPPGGESLVELAERVLSCMKEIATQVPAGTVILVSHGLALGCVVCQASGIPLQHAREHIPENGVALELDWP